MTISGKKYVECTILSNGGNGGAEAEDSSYDSDYDAEDSSQAENKLSGTTTTTHSDVSRTASDTLAAEFAEYVTVHGSLQNGIGPPPPPSTLYTPGYAARVEFALKLGYTERLVQAALQKLGPEPGQNELLAELIKLGASSAPRLIDPSNEEAAESLLPGESEQDFILGNTEPESASSPGTPEGTTPGLLRPVVIDGSNVAMSHGNKEVFSCRGIKICVDWFRSRGHREITVFVPKWRKEASRPDNPVIDQEILGELERDRLLVFTPSRLVGGKRMVCYDDRYILRLAAELDGIVVSNDNYRDLAQESPEFRKVVEERILMYSFVNDRFMPPDDPLGRSGPTLDNFLRVGPKRTEPAPPCPYAKKCTYGNKCKYRHPERGPHPHKSVTERLVEHAQRHLQARSPSLSLPLAAAGNQHSSLSKTKSWTPGHHENSTTTPNGSAAHLKSRSVENVAAEAVPNNTTAVAACVNGPRYAQSMSAANSNVQAGAAYPSSLGWVAPRLSNPEPEPANMHRKLQRQLTLNPSCDPRIGQLRHYYQQHQQQQQQHQQQQLSSHLSQPLSSPPRSAMQNRQLTRHAGNDATTYPASMSWMQQQQHHQLVTRIASAPDSSCQANWLPNINTINPSQPNNNSGIQRLGSSEPQLNRLNNQPSNLRASASWGAQEARRRLHYHLSSIFPEEQVRAAMTLHPRETDPQQICAAILAMFPKH